MFSRARKFSHIYVEEAVADHPRTRRILERFPSSGIIPVDDYQNLFGRGRQDFWRQKASPKLILARKKDNFLYSGNDFQQFGLSPDFCYNAMVLNCPYDCHYCYLQGLYPGANVVAFVNLEDSFAAVEERLGARVGAAAPLHLAVSYDTDLMALEGILGYVGEWVDWSRGRSGLCVEVRTKSAPRRFFRERPPAPVVRFAWTLSPEHVCSRYETGAPPLPSRVAALKEAVRNGWRVSICLDPVLKLPGHEHIYEDFADELAASLPWEAVEQVEIGVFRVGTQAFKRMQRRPGTDLLHYPYEHASKAVSYDEIEREALMGGIARRFSGIIPESKLILWT